MFIRRLSDVIRCSLAVQVASGSKHVYNSNNFWVHNGTQKKLLHAWDTKNMLDTSNQIKHERRWACPVIDNYDGLAEYFVCVMKEFMLIE